MPSTLPPGIGNPQEAQQATAFIRDQPWYQQMVRGWGLDPAGDANGNVNLNEQQQQQLLDAARQHGIGISDSYQIDQNGQIADVPSHVLRNVLIGAGIGAAALTGFGAAGIGPLSGLFGAGAGATEAGGLAASSVAGEGAAGAGLLGSTQIGTGMMAGLPSSVSSLTGAAGGAASGLPDWLKTARDIGSSLSSASAGRAQGRVAEGTANQNQARAAVDLYNSELAAPGKIASNAVRGDILSNAHDVNIAAPSTIPVPKITGGLHPDMFSPETRATGVGLRSNALASAANLQPVQQPVLPPLPEAGTLDSILNTGSSIANVAGSVPWDKIPWGKIASAF